MKYKQTVAVLLQIKGGEAPDMPGAHLKERKSSIVRRLGVAFDATAR